jgi:hypothetical protein
VLFVGSYNSVTQLATEYGFQGTIQDWLLSLKANPSAISPTVLFVGSYNSVTQLETEHPALSNKGNVATVNDKLRMSNGVIWKSIANCENKTVNASRLITDDDDGCVLEITHDGITLTIPTGLYNSKDFRVTIIPFGTTAIASQSSTINKGTATVYRAEQNNPVFDIIGLNTSNSFIVTGI